MSDPVRVTVALKYVDKFGDFELLTTGITVEADAQAERGETADQAIDRVYELVSNKLTEKVKSARQQMGA